MKTGQCLSSVIRSCAARAAYGSATFKGVSKGFPLLVIALASLLLGGLSSCASKPPQKKPWEVPQDAKSPDQIKWTYHPKGLTLDITADKNLNPYSGFSHTTLLCIYQLSAPTAFQELSGNIGGLVKLLQCERFDPTAVKTDRLFITPGQKTTQVFDRAEGASHVGLVAGFQQLQPGAATVQADFPVTRRRKHLWSMRHVYNPGTLTLTVMLGPDSIQNLGLD
ncbi:type VI secretion lipoprotein, family [Thiorhodovibrio winogradskyi]|uniref:Type VI secretion lipoprotein, family n=1 Tax=Thiorhodovibrio winogradskyi TaxID=77007 RepID=A0ABZ0S6L2_9GAMM|nr:type VI secretion system lipoprotein TssJ [Thiorhodovibrio winogradskyi]